MDSGEQTAPLEGSYNDFYHANRFDFYTDILSGRVDHLFSASSQVRDVILIDRPKYAPNAGSILRHLPFFGGAALFITDSSLSSEQSYQSSYTFHKKFVKEILRYAVAFTRPRCEALLILGGRWRDVFEFLRSKNYRIVGFENAEVFKEFNDGIASRHRLSRLRETFVVDSSQDSSAAVANVTEDHKHATAAKILDHDGADHTAVDAADHAATKTIPYASIYAARDSPLRWNPAIADDSRPLCLVFGGESGGLPAEALRECDEGGFIPSLLDSSSMESGCSNDVEKARGLDGEMMEENINTMRNSGEEGAKRVKQQPPLKAQEQDASSGHLAGGAGDGDETGGRREGGRQRLREKAQTCNLAVAANVVLAERFRRRFCVPSPHSADGEAKEMPRIGELADSKRTPERKIGGAGALEENLEPVTCTKRGPAPLKTGSEEDPGSASDSDYCVLLFYKFCRWRAAAKTEEKSDSRAKLVEHTERFCRREDLLGRIRIAHDGINGCLGGSEASLRKYVAAFGSDGSFDGVVYADMSNVCGKSLFDDIHWKWGYPVKQRNVNAQKLTSLSVRSCAEMVSLFGDCYSSGGRKGARQAAKQAGVEEVDAEKALLRYYQSLYMREANLEVLFNGGCSERPSFHEGSRSSGAAATSGAEVEKVEEKEKTSLEASAAQEHSTPVSGGTHLEPQEWHDMLAKEDVVLVDMRNAYETEVGRFSAPTSSCLPQSEARSPEEADVPEKNFSLGRKKKLRENSVSVEGGSQVKAASSGNYIDPGTRQFTDLPRFLVKNRAELRAKCAGKKVLAYCTGGVRCERGTQLLRLVLEQEPTEGEPSAGPSSIDKDIVDGDKVVPKQASSPSSITCSAKNCSPSSSSSTTGTKIFLNNEKTHNHKQYELYQLSGGIHAYLEKFPGGGFFRGKNFVFDQRMAVGPGDEVRPSAHGVTHGVCQRESTGPSDGAERHARGISSYYEQERGLEGPKEPKSCDNVIGKCIVCAEFWDDYTSAEARCAACRMRVLVCPSCFSSRQHAQQVFSKATSPSSGDSVGEEEKSCQNRVLLCKGCRVMT